MLSLTSHEGRAAAPTSGGHPEHGRRRSGARALMLCLTLAAVELTPGVARFQLDPAAWAATASRRPHAVHRTTSVKTRARVPRTNTPRTSRRSVILLFPPPVRWYSVAPRRAARLRYASPGLLPPASGGTLDAPAVAPGPDLSPGPSPARGGGPDAAADSLSTPPPSLAGKGAGGLGPDSGPATASHPTPPADPDAALQRLADETDQIKPSAPDALDRLKSIVRELIDLERAQRREIAALRTAPAARRTASTSRRRSRKQSAPPAQAASPSPAVSQTSSAALSGGAPAASGATQASAGMLFAKRGLKKVHRAGCVFGERIKADDRVYFKSLQEAEAAGYEPCKICHPER